MESSPAVFNHEESARRIREILAIPDSVYEERNSIPPREQLTFDNGFYVNCTAVFVDLRGSKKLAEKYSAPVLAKIYRVYISEMVAILRDHDGVREMFIEGDCVWAVYDSPKKIDIDAAFSRAYSAASLIDIANFYLVKLGLDQLTIGAGVAYGRALMIKAGYKGSGINEVVWTGRIVGEAAQLSSYGNRTPSDFEIMLSDDVYYNLSDLNRKLVSRNQVRSCWHGNVVQLGMQSWLQQQP